MIETNDYISMSEHIAFSTLEPVDDFEPSAHQWYDILRNAIQLDNKISTDDAVQNLVAIFPDTYPIGHELSIFEETCCEVAEQMPYHHASQNKLVTLLDLVLHSDKVIRPTDDPVRLCSKTLRQFHVANTLSAQQT